MSALSITTIQTDLIWENPRKNLQLIEEKISNISGTSHVVVLPEMFSTGFSMNPAVLAESMEGETVQWMRRIAENKKIILTGSIIISEPDKDGLSAYYNRLIWMLPNGNYGFYDKRHRFAYAGEDDQYTAGKQRFIASANGWKLNLMICYDLRFPVWARQQSNTDAEYDVLVCVANWPEKRILAWDTLLRARAIENQCYVVGVNRVGTDGNGIRYNGSTSIYGPVGEILYNRIGEEEVNTTLLNRDHLNEVREKFPFWRDSDRFMITT
jgi:omega-amidase